MGYYKGYMDNSRKDRIRNECFRKKGGGFLGDLGEKLKSLSIRIMWLMFRMECWL